ncbi:hypothetical protein CCP3SC15_360023 [Gammaproteobacteria bacterium]
MTADDSFFYFVVCPVFDLARRKDRGAVKKELSLLKKEDQDVDRVNHSPAFISCHCRPP